jgi:hypothetical protein
MTGREYGLTGLSPDHPCSHGPTIWRLHGWTGGYGIRTPCRPQPGPTCSFPWPGNATSGVRSPPPTEGSWSRRSSRDSRSHVAAHPQLGTSGRQRPAPTSPSVTSASRQIRMPLGASGTTPDRRLRLPEPGIRQQHLAVDPGRSPEQWGSARLEDPPSPHRWDVATQPRRAATARQAGRGVRGDCPLDPETEPIAVATPAVTPDRSPKAAVVLRNPKR